MVEAAQGGRARRSLESGPARVHVGTDTEGVDEPCGVLQRSSATHEERLRPRTVPERAEAGAEGFRMGEPAVMRDPVRGPLEQAGPEGGVTPPWHGPGWGA